MVINLILNTVDTVHEISTSRVVRHACFAGSPCGLTVAISACSNSSPVFEKPFQTAVAKGGHVCESTHLSPADGRFSGHTVLPGLGRFHSQPSKLLASHHPHDKILLWTEGLQHVVKYRSIPCFLWAFQLILNRHLFVINLLWHSKNTLCWLLFVFPLVHHIWVGSYQTETWWIETELEMVLLKWPAGLPFYLCVPALHGRVFCLSAKAKSVFPVCDVEKWALL